MSAMPEALVEYLAAERWLPIPGYEGHYEVSDWGRVRSVERRVQWRSSSMVKRARIRRLNVTPLGYHRIDLRAEGRRGYFAVHRLVLAAFVGPCPLGMEVRHLDGNPSNNRLENLAYGTHSENVRDSVRHGTHPEARKVECRWGHPFTPENTRLDTRGRRECVECRRRKNRAFAERRNAQRVAEGRARFVRVAGEAALTQVRELYAANPALTQKEIAQRVGVSQSTVSRWVRGESLAGIPGPITMRGKGWKA